MRIKGKYMLSDHKFLTNVISYCFFFGRRKESGCWQLFLIFVLWRPSVLKCKDFSSSSFDYKVNYITSIFASSPLACIKCYSWNTTLTEIWTLNLLKWIISQLFLLLWKERHFAIWHLAVIYSTSKSSFRAAHISDLPSVFSWRKCHPIAFLSFLSFFFLWGVGRGTLWGEP